MSYNSVVFHEASKLLVDSIEGSWLSPFIVKDSSLAAGAKERRLSIKVVEPESLRFQLDVLVTNLKTSHPVKGILTGTVDMMLTGEPTAI